MDAAFLPVVIGVSVLALIAAVIALATSAGAYDRIGREAGPPAGEPEEGPAAREAEIRQLLGAHNLRRAARGEPPVDVDAEVSKRLRNG